MTAAHDDVMRAVTTALANHTVEVDNGRDPGDLATRVRTALDPFTAEGTDEPFPLDLMTATPSDYLYVVRDTAGRAADALSEQIATAQKVLDSLARIATDAEDAAQLVAASDIEPRSHALVPECSGLTRKEDG